MDDMAEVVIRGIGRVQGLHLCAFNLCVGAGRFRFELQFITEEQILAGAVWLAGFLLRQWPRLPG